jgi:hypothetical protein
LWLVGGERGRNVWVVVLVGLVLVSMMMGLVVVLVVGAVEVEGAIVVVWGFEIG